MKLIELLAWSVQRHPKRTLFVLALLTLCTSWGLIRGKPRPTWADAAKGRGRSNIQRDDASAFDLRGSDCFFVVEVEDLYQANTVAALRRMVADIEALDYVVDVNWLDRVPVTNVFGLPEPLLPPDDASTEHFQDARRRVRQHPLVNGQLISRDETTLLMPVTLDWLHITDNQDCSGNLLAVARESVQNEQGIRVRLTGGVPLFVEYQTAFDRGHQRYMLIGMTVSFILAVLIFRSVFPVMMVVGVPLVGVFWTSGILCLVEEPANPLGNVVLPVLLIMVGMTDSVHLLMQIRRSRLAGMSPSKAAYDGVMQVGMACLLTSVTTAIGFGSLILADSELVRGFGRMCAVGVMMTFVAVVLLVPLLSMSRLGASLGIGSGRWSLIHTPWLDGPWIDWIIKRRVPVALFGVALTVALALISGQLRPDEKMSSYQPETSEGFQALHHCDRVFGGLDFVQVQVHWPESANGSPQSIVKAIGDVEELLKTEPLMSPPLSLNDLLAGFPGDGPIEDRMGFTELMPDDLRRFFIREKEQVAFVSSRVQDLGIAVYQPVFARLESQLKDLESTHKGFSFQLAGVPIRRGQDLYRIVVDLATSLGTASLVILAVMTLAFRSWRIGLVTILPNTLPLVFTGAILWWMGEALELASVCSFTVCLGIAVDDTIHFLTHYRQHASKESVPTAIRGAIRTVGGSLVVTTVILVSGFATVLTSELPGQRIFAAMACSTISSALIGDLILLPALLAIFGKVEAAPAAESSVAELASVPRRA